MIKLKDIFSLTEFQRNAKKHIARMKRTGKPTVLTVNGKPELVVVDAEIFDEMLDKLDFLDSVQVLRERLDQADRGETIPWEKAKEMLRRRLKVRRTA